MAITKTDTQNYRGLLYIAGQNSTPFLSMIGGLAGGKRAGTDKFALNVQSSTGAPGQNTISEDDSVTGKTATTYTKTQNSNVTQIMMEQAELSFKKGTQTAVYAGLNNDQAGSNPDGLDFQKNMALQKMAKDLNYSFIRGSFVDPTASSVNGKTRGMLEACTSNVITAGGASLSKDLMDSLLKDMYNTGSQFANPVIWVGADQRVNISNIYGKAPDSRNIGGVSVDQVYTDFGVFGVMIDPNMPADSVMVADMSTIAPVFNPINYIPDVGAKVDMVSGNDVIFVKTGQTGASFGGFYYTQVGLDYGAQEDHGKITGLS